MERLGSFQAEAGSQLSLWQVELKIDEGPDAYVTDSSSGRHLGVRDFGRLMVPMVDPFHSFGPLAGVQTRSRPFPFEGPDS